MDKAKQKKLEAKGWKFGSAADFLGLSSEEEAYIELRLRLVEALKAKRKAKFSQTEFAQVSGSSQSRVAKMEANDPSVSLDLLIKGLISLDVSLPQLGKIVASRPTVDTYFGDLAVQVKGVQRKHFPAHSATRARSLLNHNVRTSRARSASKAAAKAARKK